MAGQEGEEYGKTPAASGGADYEAAYGLLEAGKMAEAEAILRKVLAADPDHAGAHNDLGVIFSDRGETEQAVDRFKKAIALAPDAADAYTNLGNLYHAAGRFDESAKAYRKAVTLDPRDADTQTNLGNSLQALGHVEAAAASYRRALMIDPGHLLALNNLGTVLKALGRVDEAAASFRRALTIKPDFALALGNLGNVFHNQGKLTEAEDTMRRAIEAEPGFAMAHSNLGFVLRDLGRYDEAVESMKRALELDPTLAEVHSNLGTIYRSFGRLDEALACHDRALALKPDFDRARFFRALLLLLQGRFEEGWEAYLFRPSVRSQAGNLHRQALSRDLHGKRLLLLKNQGLGDEIFFLRFAPEVKKRGGEITYLANPKIASIIERLPFIDKVVGEGGGTEQDGISLSIGDLPYLLGTKSAADIPPPLALTPEPGRRDAMRARLASLGPRPYVGVTWRAGVKNKPDSVFKLAPLGDIAKALRPTNATVLVLQRNPEASEIDEFSRVIGRKAHDLTALNDDLEDMLAALSLLDEYVTVSNTNVHLRAGAGRTSRVLVPRPPEWRWMAAGEESPWFPGCRIYRQEVNGDWEGAFARLAGDLLGSSGP